MLPMRGEGGGGSLVRELDPMCHKLRPSTAEINFFFKLYFHGRLLNLSTFYSPLFDCTYVLPRSPML